MTDLDVCDLAAFIASARDRGVARVVVAWQDEYAQVGPAPADGYARVRRSTVLGYAAGVIIRLVLDDADAERGSLTAALRAADFTVEARCRNLGASDHVG